MSRTINDLLIAAGAFALGWVVWRYVRPAATARSLQASYTSAIPGQQGMPLPIGQPGTPFQTPLPEAPGPGENFLSPNPIITQPGFTGAVIYSRDPGCLIYN